MTRVPLLAETLDVGKRVVETGKVVVRKRVDEVVQQVALPPLTHEQVEIERVPVGRAVSAPCPVRGKAT